MTSIRSWLGADNRRVLPTSEGNAYFLYATPVVTVSKCGRSMKLRHGGHRTATTKAAINQVFDLLCINARVFSRFGVWELLHKDETTPFVDGAWLRL